jgi:hypothetical protein
MFDFDAVMTIGSGFSHGSGHYYIVIPSSRALLTYTLGMGSGMILAASGAANTANVAFKTGGTKIYLANTTFWWGSQWTVTSGDSVRWSARGLVLA